MFLWFKFILVTIQPVEQQADDKIVAEEDEDSNSQKGSGWLSGWGVPSLTSMVSKFFYYDLHAFYIYKY